MSDYDDLLNIKVEFLPDPPVNKKKNTRVVKEINNGEDQIEIAKENLFPDEGSIDGFDWTLEE